MRLDQSPSSLTWRTVSPGAAAKAPLPGVGTLPAPLLEGSRGQKMEKGNVTKRA